MHNPQKLHAQQVLTLAQGNSPLTGPAADPSVARSWLRCLQQHHLDPAQNIAPTIIEHASMLKRREQLQHVLEICNNEMNSLHRQLAGSGHAVMRSCLLMPAASFSVALPAKQKNPHLNALD